MNKLKIFLMMLIGALFLAVSTTTVFASDDPSITEEVTVATTEGEYQIKFDNDKIVIGEFTLTKEEAIAFLAEILEVYAGGLLKRLGIPAVILAGVLVGLAIFLLKKLVDYVKELRLTKEINSGIASTNTEVKQEIQTLAVTNAKAEARAAKAEAMNAVILDALVTLTANSSNPSIASYGAHLKTASENVLAMSDEVDEKAFKNILKTATQNVATQVVGNVLQKGKEATEALINAANIEKGKLLAALNEPLRSTGKKEWSFNDE